MKKRSGSLSKAMGMLPPCNLPEAIIVVIGPTVLWVPVILRHCFVDSLEIYTLTPCLADLCTV